MAERMVTLERSTNETQIELTLDLVSHNHGHKDLHT